MNFTKSLFTATAVLVASLSTQQTMAQQALTPQQEENLAAFAKMYGYIRYFHPSDEASSISWENFANYGSLEVMKAGNTQELVTTLNRLFNPIAPAAVIYSGQEPSLPSITPPDKAGYRTIAWQHEGVGILNSRNKGGIYKSQRVNRPVEALTANQGWCMVMQTIDANAYRDCEFRYSGRMKVLSDNACKGQLWFRVDNPSRTGFFDNMNSRPVVSDQWQTYTISGRINKDADNLAFGAMIINDGKVLVDDIKLEVKKGDNWVEVPVPNGDFEEYSNNQPGKWQAGKQLDGYNYQTERADVSSGKAALVFSSPKKIINTTRAKPLYDGYPGPGEYTRVQLSAAINCAFPLTLYGTDLHTYPAGDSISLKKLQQELNTTYSKGQTADLPGIRFSAVVITWNIFKHFFAYWEDASATPEQILRNSLKSAATDKSGDDFMITLRKMLAPLNDGHIWVYGGGMPGKTPVGVVLAFAEGKAVIAKLIDTTLADRLMPGDIITHVDGEPVDSVVTRLTALFSGSRQLNEKRAAELLLSGVPESAVKLDLLRNNTSLTATVTRSTTPQAYSAATRKTYPMGWIKPGVYYINLDQEPLDSINPHLHEIAGAKALVCDLRGYPNSNHELLRHMLTKKEKRNWMYVPRITKPDQAEVTYRALGWNLTPLKPHISGKVFFLTDGGAISYAESYLGYVKDEKLGTIIGGATAGTNGNINTVALPGGFMFSFTGMLVKNHDGSKHHLKGIVPDVPVSPTVAGLAAGRDEVLDKALELAEK
ncbi:C-terminal processing protease CtpA/Prc, contains a PDZ domain [Chitinophaga jiangningensis]|uniref:C-terminal processing protease CtpA/Prc, contains a PDZ domain n=1 Tax=Chitinophaga jiangningensis TaxID=1419482 RepID=A0A1M6YNH9_9BACT|nr:S41 family peptidase [Chitinophaga jiangningensis]SHL19569.1 C-terminal processing protease CtpA/Prc, contains a PDZ domain [Chitinophaga jiangningensis]